jgi:hypothetical protein
MSQIKTDKSFFLYLYLSFFILLSGFLIFYLFNPFDNECIRGNCENGKGVYIFQSGMKDDGEWKNGKRDGQGTLTYPDGSKYTGRWKNNRMHGKGTKIYVSDAHYTEYAGEWKKGNKHGTGTAIYTGGELYEGEWKEGKKHGYGTLITSDGRKLTGKFENEILQGTTTEIYPDGKVLVVEMRNGIKHGPGVITYPDGTKVTGNWINNKLVGSLEYYLFRGIEFEKRYSITRLCSAIKADISLSLDAHENTIPWLNELLKTPNLYEAFNKKIQAAGSSQEIDALIERTKDLRNKAFPELNVDNQKNIVKLNRLLIEHLYPQRTPKI